MITTMYFEYENFYSFQRFYFFKMAVSGVGDFFGMSFVEMYCLKFSKIVNFQFCL